MATSLSKVCLLLVSAITVVVTSEVPQRHLATYTNGDEYVVWNHAEQATNRNRRSVVTCVVKRHVPLEEMSKSVVKRSDSEFDEDKKQCARHNRHRRMIMFGTNWCGAGNDAEHYHDLGYYEDEDKCCRQHDHCDRNLVGGESQYGVNNTSPYTWSDCDCDRAFRTCLQNVSTFMGDTIGDMFFDILQSIKCLEFQTETTAVAQDKGTYKRQTGVWEYLTGWLG